MNGSTRPCTCDRFTPGKPFRPKIDCNKCWLFAHKPAVRSFWGGNPNDCHPLRIATSDMEAAELADLIEHDGCDLPEGWKLWPVSREAHLILVERFLAQMPSYPEGKFHGRGLVICGGGRYEASIYVCCRMLRHVGWEHPIQVWHRGNDEPVSERVRRLPGVEVIDIETHPLREHRRIMGGWESKSFAMINSPFEEVMFLDADCYPIFNPEECFEESNNPHGVVIWPDNQFPNSAVHWETYGVTADDHHGLNGGHYVFGKRKAWPVLQLASHYDNHSDFYYWRTYDNVPVGAFGDQEQVRVALRKLNFPYHRYRDAPFEFERGFFYQSGPNGRPLFVHRVTGKFAQSGQFPNDPQWTGSRFPMEATAWKFFLEWMTTALDSAEFPDEIPGWFTQAECALWSKICRGRDVLELGRHHGRSTVVAASTARKVVSIDLLEDAEADFWLQRYDLRHKVWLRVGYFHDLAPNSGGPFSACLIDGAHDRDSVTADIELVAGLMMPGGLIGFHDYDSPAFPGVREAVDRAISERGWKLVDRADHLAVIDTTPASM